MTRSRRTGRRCPSGTRTNGRSRSSRRPRDDSGEPALQGSPGRPQRAAVYRVSPAARVLQSHLEGVESFWIDHSCEYQKDTVVPCDDYGSYISWAMRDAAVQTGVSTAAEFQEFFRRIADEIAAACNSGELTCGHGGLFGVLPPLDSLSKRVVVSGFD